MTGREAKLKRKTGHFALSGTLVNEPSPGRIPQGRVEARTCHAYSFYFFHALETEKLATDVQNSKDQKSLAYFPVKCERLPKESTPSFAGWSPASLRR